MSQTVRLGLLGAARIAPKAVCAPAGVVAGVRLAGVAARDRDRAEAFARENHIADVFDSYESLLASDNIDLVYNALPINHHAEWTIKALKAGKHVLCEKPFAMNADEARAMLDAAKRSDRRVIEAFHYRYHPAFETCLAWLKAGRIGEITRIDAQFDVEIPDSDTEIRHLPETGGGAMMDLGCYPLSWALNLVGDLTLVDAVAETTRRGVDESMRARLQGESGAWVHLTTSMAPGTPFKAEMTIAGTEGLIYFQNPLAPHNGGSLSMRRADGSEVDQMRPVSPISTYTYQLAAVASALKTRSPLPTEGDAILHQQSLLDGIYDAAGLRQMRYR